MAAEPRTVPVEPGSQLDAALDATPDAPLLLERAGRLYRLEPVGRSARVLEAGADEERVRQALRQGAGFLNGIDVEELLADIRAQRGQDSQGRPGDC